MKQQFVNFFDNICHCVMARSYNLHMYIKTVSAVSLKESCFQNTLANLGTEQ
jgi:hypothetical protein